MEIDAHSMLRADGYALAPGGDGPRWPGQEEGKKRECRTGREFDGRQY